MKIDLTSIELLVVFFLFSNVHANFNVRLWNFITILYFFIHARCDRI